MLLSLIVPTYNERQSIVPLLQRATAALEEVIDQFEIIAVDDDSPDGTWQAAEQVAEDNPHVRVIRRRKERGLATAVIAGWKTAEGELLGVIDGDLQHPPEILPVLLKSIVDSRVDIAIASRNVEGGGVSQWRPQRKIIAWVARSVARLAFPELLSSVRDPMSGYFIIKRSVIESVVLKPLGYKILLEVLARGKYQTIKEIPYVFEERKIGKSKLGPKQCLDLLIHLWRLSREIGKPERTY
jgi:dolichol-phosphate mannosyltransferase